MKKLYPDKKDLSESMKRHMEFFNTTPYVVTFPLAISAAMEEKRAENPDNFGTGDAVTSVQSLIDGIVPRLLPLVLFGIVWKLLKKKKVSPLVMMLAMIVIGIIGAYFNIWG